MSERDIQKAIMLACGKIPSVRVFRNDCGNGVVGKIKDLGGGNFHVHGHRLSFGLHPGSSDLIGWQTINGVGVFLAIEVKSETGRLRPDQENFIQVVRSAGGRAIVARSVEEAVAGLVDGKIL
jgi:hypothetical protein